MNTEKYSPKYCAVCSERLATKIISKQIHGEWHRLMVCEECGEKHERELEMTRSNFKIQFGEK